jgi:hypothetical protein
MLPPPSPGPLQKWVRSTGENLGCAKYYSDEFRHERMISDVYSEDVSFICHRNYLLTYLAVNFTANPTRMAAVGTHRVVSR